MTTISQNKALWTTIKEETVNKENTANRVGTAGEALADSLAELAGQVYAPPTSYTIVIPNTEAAFIILLDAVPLHITHLILEFVSGSTRDFLSRLPNKHYNILTLSFKFKPTLSLTRYGDAIWDLSQFGTVILTWDRDMNPALGPVIIETNHLIISPLTYGEHPFSNFLMFKANTVSFTRGITQFNSTIQVPSAVFLDPANRKHIQHLHSCTHILPLTIDANPDIEHVFHTPPNKALVFSTLYFPDTEPSLFIHPFSNITDEFSYSLTVPLSAAVTDLVTRAADEVPYPSASPKIIGTSYNFESITAAPNPTGEINTATVLWSATTLEKFIAFQDRLLVYNPSAAFVNDNIILEVKFHNNSITPSTSDVLVVVEQESLSVTPAYNNVPQPSDRDYLYGYLSGRQFQIGIPREANIVITNFSQESFIKAHTVHVVSATAFEDIASDPYDFTPYFEELVIRNPTIPTTFTGAVYSLLGNFKFTGKLTYNLHSTQSTYVNIAGNLTVALTDYDPQSTSINGQDDDVFPTEALGVQIIATRIITQIPFLDPWYRLGFQVTDYAWFLEKYLSGNRSEVLGLTCQALVSECLAYKSDYMISLLALPRYSSITTILITYQGYMKPNVRTPFASNQAILSLGMRGNPILTTAFDNNPVRTAMILLLNDSGRFKYDEDNPLTEPCTSYIIPSVADPLLPNEGNPFFKEVKTYNLRLVANGYDVEDSTTQSRDIRDIIIGNTPIVFHRADNTNKGLLRVHTPVMTYLLDLTGLGAYHLLHQTGAIHL